MADARRQTAFTTLYWLDSFKCYCVRGESVGSLGGIVSTMEEVSLMLPVAGKADLVGCSGGFACCS